MFFMVLVLLVAVKPEKVHTTLFSSTPSKRERVDVLFYSYLTLMLLLCYSYWKWDLQRIYNGLETEVKGIHFSDIIHSLILMSFSKY